MVRRAKYALIAPIIDTALAAFPLLSRKAPPPAAINISGSGTGYIESGRLLAEQLVRDGLRDGQTVVEIGAGMGGNALALWKHFGNRIAFKSFDIVKFAVTWSRQHFAQLGSAYAFTHADVFNSFYNPFGKSAPDGYVFPYADGSAELVFANSVFTHMQEGEVEHYFAESARILRPGGLAWFTFFLLDADSEAQLAKRETYWSFDHGSGSARVYNADEPDHAVAYADPWVRAKLIAAGFEIRSVERGSWRGHEAGYFQDIVIAIRSPLYDGRRTSGSRAG